MSGPANLDADLARILGQGRAWTFDDILDATAGNITATSTAIEIDFGGPAGTAMMLTPTLRRASRLTLLELPSRP